MITAFSHTHCTIFTIGHSNRSWNEFLGLLRAFQITMVADVRSMPGSNRYPHFNQAPMEECLAASGIGYRRLKELGGRRKKIQGLESPNMGLISASFRNYADYMLTEEFRAGLERLVALSPEYTVALLCAEAFYPKCHRRLISDALTAGGVEVRHIVTLRRAEEHLMTPGARIVAPYRVVYPPVEETT